MADIFGDRMKMYEKQETQKFLPLLPVCARLDGKNFSKFTKKLERPYDYRLSALMEATTKFLVRETNACIGYTQSDEISLVWYSDSVDSQIFFDGKKQKIVSVLASMCTAYFNSNLECYISEKKDSLAFFDCRVWQLPNLDEGANVFLWRELDATKNSVSMACREYYSHKRLMYLGRAEQMDLLYAKGINWNDYPAFFKRGTYYQRCKVWKKFSVEELAKLPEKHEARSNPNLEIARTEVRRLEMPPLTKIVNRVDVIFNGDEPKVLEDE